MIQNFHYFIYFKFNNSKRIDAYRKKITHIQGLDTLYILTWVIKNAFIYVFIYLLSTKFVFIINIYICIFVFYLNF